MDRLYLPLMIPLPSLFHLSLQEVAGIDEDASLVVLINREKN